MAKAPAYTVNLDPAVQHLPYGSNIDIRKTVKYKEVMKQYVHRVVAGASLAAVFMVAPCTVSRYGLGPNGAIMTSLNLFATRFDQVMKLLEKRAPSIE